MYGATMGVAGRDAAALWYLTRAYALGADASLPAPPILAPYIPEDKNTRLVFPYRDYAFKCGWLRAVRGDSRLVWPKISELSGRP